MPNPETPSRRIPLGRITEAVRQRKSEEPIQTAEERHRYVRAGEIIAVQEGVIKDLAPFEEVYSGTVSILQGVRPTSFDYDPKTSADEIPSKDRKRKLTAVSKWRFPNLIIPGVEEMVTVNFSVNTPVMGDFTRQSEDDELAYAMWYLREYKPVQDRLFRRSLSQPRTLLDTRVRRGKTDNLEQVVVDTLLAKSTDIYFDVSRTHAEPKDPPLYFGHARSLDAKLGDSNTYLQTDNPLNLEEIVTKRRYNWKTGKLEGPTPEHIEAFLRSHQFDDRTKRVYGWLEEINFALKHAGYTESL